MNLPNKITVLRMCLVPFFVLCMLCTQIPYNNYIAVGIFIVASLTDFFDGYIARKYHLVTNFGKFMDPLADKLLVCSALICFVSLESIQFPAWIAIIIIGREFIISGFRLVASDSGVVLAASYWGKFKTTAQMIMSILLILQIQNKAVVVVEQIFIYISLALTIISLLDYLIKNKTVLADGQK